MIAQITWKDISGKTFRTRVEQQTKYPHNLLFNFQATTKGLKEVLSAEFFRKTDFVKISQEGGGKLTLSREEAVERCRKALSEATFPENGRYAMVLEQLLSGKTEISDPGSAVQY